MRNLSGTRGRRAILLLFLAALLLICSDTGSAKPAVFEMTEIDVFDPELEEKAAGLFTRGHRGQCEEAPEDRAKKYPELKSEHPWFGSVRFDGSYLISDSGMKVYFVGDESEGTSKGYDRLYIDLDRDLDLTNDPVVKPMKDPPKHVVPSWKSKQRVIFDCIAVTFDFGPGLGKRPFRAVPRLGISEHKEKEYAAVSFIATVARKGRIKIGSAEYDALMAQRYLVSGRFDRPWTSLLLTRVDEPNAREERWWGAEELHGMRCVDGTWYSISTTPLGEKLLVTPYEGDFGVFKVGPGKRDLDKLSVRGSLCSQTRAVPVGERDEKDGSYKAAQECLLPVGDYRPSYLTLEYGRLRLSLSENYHSDGHVRDRRNRPWVHGIQIRKDKPFALDFSNPPEVMFTSPAKNVTFAPDDEITVKAVLIDPVLDIMIRGLTDTSSKKEKVIKLPDGEETKRTEQLSLDPVVTITDSKGTIVNEGTMPFG